MAELHKRQIEPDIVVLELSGQITMGRDCQRTEWAIMDLVNGSDRKVVLDLSKLEYVDSAGIGMIVTCGGKMEAAGGQIRLAALRPKIQDLLRVAKLDRILSIFPDVDEAVREWTT